MDGWMGDICTWTKLSPSTHALLNEISAVLNIIVPIATTLRNHYGSFSTAIMQLMSTMQFLGYDLRHSAVKLCGNINNKITSYKSFSQGQSTLMPSEMCFLESVGNCWELSKRHLALLSWFVCVWKSEPEAKKSQSCSRCGHILVSD